MNPALRWRHTWTPLLSRRFQARPWSRARLGDWLVSRYHLHMTCAPCRLIYRTVGWSRKRILERELCRRVCRRKAIFAAQHIQKSDFRRDFFRIIATMSMTVKAYLVGKDDCNKEIRRFAVDQDVSTSFEYLKRKVLDVFVGLRTAPFQMYYKGKWFFFIWLYEFSLLHT